MDITGLNAICLSLPDADIGNTQRASLLSASLNTYSTSIAVPGVRLVKVVGEAGGIGKVLITGVSGTSPPCAVVPAVGVVQKTVAGVNMLGVVLDGPVGQFTIWMGWLPIIEIMNKPYGAVDNSRNGELTLFFRETDYVSFIGKIQIQKPENARNSKCCCRVPSSEPVA